MQLILVIDNSNFTGLKKTRMTDQSDGWKVWRLYNRFDTMPAFYRRTYRIIFLILLLSFLFLSHYADSFRANKILSATFKFFIFILSW